MQLFYPLHSTSDNIGVSRYHQLEYNKSYIPMTGCILSRIFSCAELSSLEKIYYILVDSLSYINNQKGRNRSVPIPAKNWAKRLACSKSEVFVLQKSLEDKRYFIISRDKNDNGQNKRNTITTTIPDKVFENLKFEPNRFDLRAINDTRIDNNVSEKLNSIDNTFVSILDGKRQHLEKTKMFIRMPYEFLKQLNSNCSISATSKIIILYLFTKRYKSSAHKHDLDEVITHNAYSFITTSQELQKGLKLHRNSISKSLKDLEDNNLISKKQFFVKDTEDYKSRTGKSLSKISLLSVSLINPNDQQEQKQPSITNDQDNIIDNNKASEFAKEWGCTKYDPPCTDSGQLYNKNLVLKNKYYKNIDTNYKNLSVSNSENISAFKKAHKKEFLENEQNSFSSESYKNSSFSKNLEEGSVNKTQESGINKNDNSGRDGDRPNGQDKTNDVPKTNPNTSTEYISRTIIGISEKEIKRDKGRNGENTTSYKELRHFYPLSDKDISNLNFYADRDFSSNFVNQLLLKLYIKYPDKKFRNKFTFLSYMKKILRNEKHQGPLVNHTNFRFICNISVEDKNMQYYEKYLSSIENSLDISKETQIKKKIAGKFNTKLAYHIIKQVNFKANFDNSFITALIPTNKNLDLSESQIESLSQQLEAVYGKNGGNVQEVDDMQDSDK